MAKTRNFSVYLLKSGYDSTNALKDGLDISLVDDDETNIPDGGVMYYGNNTAKSPWWKAYWGINSVIHQETASAIVFLPVEGRWFALTFGSSYHYLKEKSYEYDFGIRTTLNALDPEKIKSTDLLTPETAKRQRIQLPNASNLTYFDFSTDESIVKRLTGAVKDEYEDLFHNATGSSSLRFATACEPEGLLDLCSQLLEIYGKRDYETTFPDLQNIIPVKDPDLIDVLNDRLIEDFNNESFNLYLAIPEIVDYSSNFKIKFKGCGRSDEYDDVFLAYYRSYLKSYEIEAVDISMLSKHSLCVYDDNNVPKGDYSVYKALLYDCIHEGKTYHLCEGNWYEIKTDFIEKLKEDLDPVFVDDHALLRDCEEQREDSYNLAVQQKAPGGSHAYCLDKTSIAPHGQSAVEPCDLIALKGSTVEFIHNKISTRSASLSHLFNQGLNSVILITQSAEAKEKLKSLINHDGAMEEIIDDDKYHVTFGIISKKGRELKSESLPIFSRISLLRCVKSLKLMKVGVSVYLIKDKVTRKKTDIDN